MGDGSLVDSMVHDGLTDAFEDIHMGETAERVADRYGVSREAMDEYAAESQRRAHAATEAGRFAAEILPVEVPARKGAVMVERDESIRPDVDRGVARAPQAGVPQGRPGDRRERPGG